MPLISPPQGIWRGLEGGLGLHDVSNHHQLTAGANGLGFGHLSKVKSLRSGSSRSEPDSESIPWQTFAREKAALFPGNTIEGDRLGQV